jgi:hypothetical protein
MRSAMIISALAGCALLAACDQNPKSDNVTINGRNGNVTISANGHQFSIKAEGDKNGSFSMSGDSGHFTMHASDGKQTVDINSTGGSRDVHIPDFVTSYPGAKRQSTTVGSSVTGTTGAVTFETTDSPAAVIAFYKQKSAGAGLSQAANMNMGPMSMFTANADGGKKTLQVIASPSGSGAHVQVNWAAK